MRLRNITITSALALSGVLAWSYGAVQLAEGGSFDYRPNPLGLKESPYGEVIALAVQGGIDSDWHGLETESAGHACPTCGHDHGADGKCPEDEAKKEAESRTLLGRLEEAVTERTNERPATAGHKFYLRRQVEDRLKMAYELDPSNYANYNSYHLFLTEPSVGTRPVLTKEVIDLANRTIQYCMEEESDPRHALTAASAVGNVLELMFIHHEDYPVDQMRTQLGLLDYTLAKHHALSDRWKENGDYDRLSEARKIEMSERLDFVTKVREAAEKTIERLSKPTQISSKG